jgi:DNA-binding HxlR family transcriptional regulator
MEDKKMVDDICDKIILFLLAREKKIRFNKLQKALDKSGFKISKPTLSKHLKHLTKDKIVKRKKEGKQNISYEFNWERFKFLHKILEDDKTTIKHLKNRDNQQSTPLDIQAIYLMNILAILNIQCLKLRALIILEPENAFEYNIAYEITTKIIQNHIQRFAESCKQNKKECRKKAIPEIETLTERLTKLLD